VHGLHAAGAGVSVLKTAIYFTAQGRTLEICSPGGSGSVTLVGMSAPTLPARSLASWFFDLRKTALVACITSVLSLPIPLWNSIQPLLAIESTHPGMKWWIISVSALALLFIAIIPAFYFALYRDGENLRVPKRLRLLALATACTSGAIAIVGLPAWIKSLGRYWAWMTTLDWKIGATNVLIFARDPRTLGQIGTLFAEFSNTAYVLLLVAIFRRESDPLEIDVPISRLLIRATKVAVIAWGIVSVGTLVGLALTPYSFITLRNLALQIGRMPPTFGVLLAERIQSVLAQACLFAAPYIVYRSISKGPEIPADAQSGSN
jgi:hypothetical protein